MTTSELEDGMPFSDSSPEGEYDPVYAAEKAATQLVDTALSLLLESRHSRDYLDVHYWLRSRLDEAWRGR